MMGILDKIMFWKKGESDLGDLSLGGEDLGLGKDFTGMEGIGTGKPGEMPGFGEKEYAEGIERPLGPAPEAPKTQEINSQGYDYETPNPYTQQRMQPQQMQSRHDQQMIGRELELISTKLDSIKITLDNLNMRVAALERIARGDYEKTW